MTAEQQHGAEMRASAVPPPILKGSTKAQEDTHLWEHSFYKEYCGSLVCARQREYLNLKMGEKSNERLGKP